jgi:hypothetical protein
VEILVTAGEVVEKLQSLEVEDNGPLETEVGMKWPWFQLISSFSVVFQRMQSSQQRE